MPILELEVDARTLPRTPRAIVEPLATLALPLVPRIDVEPPSRRRSSSSSRRRWISNRRCSSSCARRSASCCRAMASASCCAMSSVTPFQLGWSSRRWLCSVCDRIRVHVLSRVDALLTVLDTVCKGLSEDNTRCCVRVCSY